MSAQVALEKTHPFFQIYNTVIDHYRLNPYEMSLYAVLVRHANYKTRLAFPGYSRLMELTGMARATVAKYLRSLERKNLIRIIRRWQETKKGNRQRRVNHYYILDPHGADTLPVHEVNQGSSPDELEVVHAVDHPGSNAEPPVVHAVNRNETNQNETKTNNTDSNQEGPALRAGRSSRAITDDGLSDSAPETGAVLPDISKGKEDWQIFCHQLADLCRLDFDANAGKIRKFASKLWRSSEGYSPADLEIFERWWYDQDWRGKKGDVPRLNEVCEGIRAAVYEQEWREATERAHRYRYIEGELAAYIDY
jgi:DNA-binding MarR family transcriptional regulator